MKIHLQKSVSKTLRRISERDFPNEACAVLLGKKKDGKIIVKDVVKAENVLESTTKFKIEPEFVVKIMEKAENQEQELVGFFHSHPQIPAFVSSRDEKFMDLWLEKIWLIAGLENLIEKPHKLQLWDGSIVYFRSPLSETHI